MATRRSARLQSQPTQEVVADEQPATISIPRGKEKSKAPANKRALTKGVSKGKEKVATSTIGKGKKSQTQVQPSSTKDKLSTLPPETLNLILSNIKDPSTINALSRTCKHMYSLMMPRLYDRIAVAAMFHAHIPKLIRTLEPHLTIAQKKQLKKEGKYKGQQERYPTGLNESAKPICATYVRQMIVGAADPGKKHRYIVDRYVEEAFKNMNNLEIVETRILTKSMAQSLASLKNLKALRLFLPGGEAEDNNQLTEIKNLKHLQLDHQGYLSYSANDGNSIQSLLLKSMSTLQSLSLSDYAFSRFSWVWKRRASVGGEDHDFIALKSLSLTGITVDADAIKSLHKAFDLMRLRELTLLYIRDTDSLLLPYLTSLITAPQGTGGTDISLRRLSLQISDENFRGSPGQSRGGFEAKCRFISSFNALTTLELPNYGQYPDTIATNPGLPDMLLQAILKHRTLRTLRLSYNGISSGFKIPYLSASTVGAIIGGLPHLQEFEFAPEEEQMNQIGQALARCTNLTDVTCFNYPGDNIISGVLQGFLSRDDIKCTENFVWEDHYKLKRVSTGWKTWEVASKFGKGLKGMLKPESIKSDKDEKREVLFRDVTNSFNSRIHVGFDPDHIWVDKVDRDIV